MGFGGALDLGDFDKRLVGKPRARPGLVHRLAGIGLEGKHAAIRGVRVVRNGERVNSRRALRLHPGPEIFGVDRLQRRENGGGRLVPEDHVAVQVAGRARFGADDFHRREFIARKGRELAGLVVLLGRLNRPCPDGIHRALIVDFGDRLAGHEGHPDLLEDLRGLLSILPECGPRSFRLGQGVPLGIHRRHDPEIFAMIGHGEEIERRAFKLDVKAGILTDRLAFRETVGILRCAPHAEHISVERVAGVDVHIPEIGIADRVEGDAVRCPGFGLRRLRRGVLLRCAARCQQDGSPRHEYADLHLFLPPGLSRLPARPFWA